MNYFDVVKAVSTGLYLRHKNLNITQEDISQEILLHGILEEDTPISHMFARARCKGIDYIRKVSKKGKALRYFNASGDDDKHLLENICVEETVDYDLINHLYSKLDSFSIDLLNRLYFKEEHLDDIAEDYRVSKTTIFVWKMEVLLKCKRIIDDCR